MPTKAQQAKRKASKRKTTIFRKLLTTPKLYKIRGKDHDLNETVLRQIADNGNRLIAKGARIPTPYAHADENGNVPSPVNVNEGAIIDFQTGKPIGWRSDLNAGYVKSFGYGDLTDENGETVTGLYGELEVDGDPSDKYSAAAKIGSTIRETSMGLWPGYSDSDGDTYEGYTPIHAALVTNAVEANQTNFQDTEQELAIAMSDTIFMAIPPETDDNPAASTDILTAQKSPLAELITLCNEGGISLPEDTTIENLVERLTLLIKQKVAQGAASAPTETELPKAPAGGSSPSAPIAMSETTPKPETVQPTDATAEAKPTIDLSSIFLSQLVKHDKARLTKKVEKLIATGRSSADYVKKNLVPRIEAITMSVATLTEDEVKQINETGQLPKTPIEEIIEGLESSSARDLTQPTEETAAPPQDGETPEPTSYDQTNFWEKDENQEQFGGNKLSDAELADEWANV